MFLALAYTFNEAIRPPTVKSMAVRNLDETSPSSSLSAAAVLSRKGTPKGLPALLNKLVRAVLISKPLQAVHFLADYLDAELNRRTLCQLQDLGMTVCGEFL